MSETEIVAHLYASLSYTCAEGEASWLAPFDASIHVPASVADLAVGSMGGAARDLLMPYLEDRLTTAQDATSIRALLDGVVVAEHPRDPDAAYHNDDEDPMNWFFTLDPSDLISFQIGGVSAAEN